MVAVQDLGLNDARTLKCCGCDFSTAGAAPGQSTEHVPLEIILFNRRHTKEYRLCQKRTKLDRID